MSQYVWTRDLQGYGGAPPHAGWPGGARVAVSFVLNIEEGAERSVLAGDPINEPVYDKMTEIVGAPNLHMLSNFNYGPRAGHWRVVELLDRYGVACTASACAQALEATPWIAEDCVRRGYEVACHGYRWAPTATLSVAAERELIARSVESMRRICGVRPYGWHSRNPESLNTRRLVIEEGGFLYDSDSTEDDLPYLIDTGGHEHVVVPYTADNNDMFMQRPEGFYLPRHLAEYVIAAFDRLYDEGVDNPKMMSIGLHGRIIGTPARISALEMILKHLTSRPQVWFATRVDIARHWRAKFGRTA